MTVAATRLIARWAAIALAATAAVAETVPPPDETPITVKANKKRVTTITVTIGVDGRVTGCRIAVPSGVPAMDERSCALAFRRFRFTPATANGVPVASTKTMPIRWQITDPDDATPRPPPPPSPPSPAATTPPP